MWWSRVLRGLRGPVCGGALYTERSPRQGREILQKTVDLARDSLNLDVIYGLLCGGNNIVFIALYSTYFALYFVVGHH